MIVRPRTFTFYSYKGGVGRSMALLNVAYCLQAMGRHVLVVDLDLEAPGVSGFLHRKGELVEVPPEAPDVVDLLAGVMPLTRWDMSEESRPASPALGDFLREVKPERHAPAQNKRFRRTRLDVLAASDQRDYTDRLAQLQMSQYNADEIARAGDLLRGIFFSHTFQWSWLEAEEKPTGYDYILIDSRTGFTETGGLCIGPLADRLVIFCGLNDQNINGTAEFLKTIGLTSHHQGPQWDDADAPEDESRPASLGEKPSIIVASPVPHGEMELKKARFDIMEQTFGIKPAVSITYHPRLALFETIFCKDGPEESIAGEYRRLMFHLMRMVGDHPAQIQERIQPFRGGKTDATPSTDELRKFASAAADEEAIDSVASLFGSIGYSLSDQAKQKTGAEADALLLAAGAKYEAALAIKPDQHDALNNWGIALADQAKQKTGAEAEALFAAAGAKYEAALAIKPDKHEALNNWGNALADQAKQKTGAEAEALFAAAGAKYEAALVIHGHSAELEFNLACLYALLGELPPCLAWLEQAREAGLPLTRGKLDKDGDFDKIRDVSAFLAFRDSLPE